MWNNDSSYDESDVRSGICLGGAGTCKIELILVIKSSNPKIVEVSANPRSPRQSGHFFNTPPSPLYQRSMQLWHPTILLQHRANIAGGTKGLPLHIEHLKASNKRVDNPRGRWR